MVIDLAKKGYSPSMIGMILRDQYGVPLVKPIVGKGIVELLEEAGMAPKLPQDLEDLLKKAVRLSRHLKANRKDKVNVRSLQLVESKIHRLSKYYKRRGILPKAWRYKYEIAKVL